MKVLVLFYRVLAYTAGLVAAIVDEDSPRVLVCNSQSPAPATRQENKNNQPLCYSISRRKYQHSGRQVQVESNSSIQSPEHHQEHCQYMPEPVTGTGPEAARQKQNLGVAEGAPTTGAVTG